MLGIGTVKVKFLLGIAVSESGRPTTRADYFVFVDCEGLILIMINASKHFRIHVFICISLT